jgi:hypothetical protein
MLWSEPGSTGAERIPKTNTMATAAQTAANIANAQASTGPRTQSGKDASSRNAIAFGLFTLHDFVRPEEYDEYSALVAGLREQLNPEGALEEAFAVAIIGATWRLRRCSLIEARMLETCLLDPMEDESAARLQSSVDRARAQAHNILRRSVAELRRLQTQRIIRYEIFGPHDTTVRDLTSYSEVVKSLNNHDRGKLLARKLDGIDTLAALNAPLPKLAGPPAPELALFCKTPRNAPCPCGSGQKHKRCCGKSAPPILHRAA